MHKKGGWGNAILKKKIMGLGIWFVFACQKEFCQMSEISKFIFNPPKNQTPMINLFESINDMDTWEWYKL